MAVSGCLATALIRMFEEQLKTRPFHDVTIRIRDTRFSCHRFILSACSLHFREKFSHDTGSHFSQEIEVNDIEPETFNLIMQCVYGAKEVFTEDNVESVWDAAKVLQIEFICKACEDFQFKRLSKESCVEICIHAKKVEASDLLEKARELMTREFDFLRKRDDLLALDFEELKLLVSDDDLEAKSEDDVIETVLRWTRSQSNGRDDDDADSRTRRSYKRMLQELLRSSRVCLVSPTFLNTLLDDECVLKSSNALEVAREALRYRLQPGRRHDYCPPHAMHRNNSSLQNVTVVFGLDEQGAYKMSCRSPDGAWYALNKALTSKVSAVTYDDDLYMVSTGNDVNPVLRYKVSNGAVVQLNTLRIGRDECVLVCVGNYIYIIGGTDNRSIERFKAKEAKTAPKSVKLEKVGDLQFEVTNVMAVVTGKYILVFGMRTDSDVTSVQSFDTSTMTSHVYDNNLMGEEDTTMVSFKNGKDTFVLKDTGDLWRLVKCDNQELKLEYRGKLFEDKLSLHGAVVFNKELLIMATSINPQMSREFSINKLKNVSTIEIIEGNFLFVLNTVIPKKYLTTKDVQL